ncbi:MAG TPA: hypothetical protein VJV79_00260 [Polyangiaceae bacterium]|nr:hypothetical protein [Polyangiaceae bacterium]
MESKQLEALILQSLEHELGGVQVYQTALSCVLNGDLKQEWQKYLSETQNHVTKLNALCGKLGIDAEQDTPGRQVVRRLGGALVDAMRLAHANAEPAAAELVACECVVLAETKDHLDWQLLGKCAERTDGEVALALKEAYDAIEDEEDEHLYHTKGWCRELWLQSLGIPAVLPPPEERRQVKTAIGAAKAEQAAEKERL